ncbi:MAG: hypothetical protein GW779_03665 [Candidatus Altiarchaeum hamiconexum]|uniref:Uncharacterized protein n=1 Tax=Candidatus Altarchaeum hamiconexum TaxID=1803513 RepID=A0A8J7YX79_9ARCH|nr:hypothetical protein [Candidatus Altarchaeum hamiconexum]OIQ04538.1 MAG: hypothetical protein AUK59_07405 [Candidatus Altarchaeum sp. CG2_30_32_3053]PIN67873.1 MAG: hypothetical protein COV98_01205 [Candidatus Altarchaeum sp. CG12_big_fil_rev_8_21_14_0_65_33_22]PIV27312.1 MAG: hypothetical protein COS36_06195 [Candidatus Altarchaeum sp. CG03_land_8_20_14_0_80_32_618]PIZ29418.1 MAG: hypothetical protein COY41_05570 [Candidatus Altarchaeum sp. CG_4_10_14_0_8_um_filter_32_851]PJC13383.1 MAG: h
MVKANIDPIVKAGKIGNKTIAVTLIFLLLVMGALSLINISKSLYSTAMENEGSLMAKEAKDMLSDTMTILIITALIGALVFYLQDSPKFLTTILLAAVVAICKAVMVIDFKADEWTLYIGIGILAVALAYTINLLKGMAE